MAEPARFVHIVDDVPEMSQRQDGAGPVLVYALEGFLDAGGAAARAVEHLLEQSPGRVVASFDVDAFFDYRARRPPMTFAEDHYRDYEAPRLVVRSCTDGLGAPYLLMHGPEPDTHWEAFAAGVRQVIEHFEVRLAVSLGAVPMAVPHTRPVMLTQHATSSDLLVQKNVWRGEIRIPASAASMLELRLGEWGHRATGFVAHVPHYLAQTDFPSAAAGLVEGVEVVTGLQWPLEALQRLGATRQAEIAAQVEDSAELRELVAGLEQQYDAFASVSQGDSLPLAEERDLPTAEQLGEEFERFLAGLDGEEE